VKYRVNKSYGILTGYEEFDRHDQPDRWPGRPIADAVGAEPALPQIFLMPPVS
jgi:hypothetical protein